jgi:hypothetical protein
VGSAPELGGDSYEVAAWLRREGAWDLLIDFTRANPEVGPLPLRPYEGVEVDELPDEPPRQRPAPGAADGHCPLHGWQPAVWFTTDEAASWEARCSRAMPGATKRAGPHVCFRVLSGRRPAG